MFTDFKDSSTNGFAITANGDAQLVKTVKKYGNAAGYFDGDGDYLELPDNEAFDFGDEDFTIECWFNSNLSGYQALIAKWGNDQAFFIGVDPATPRIQFYVNGELACTGGTIQTNQWYHVAAVRNGTSIKLFLDGTQIGSTYNIGNDPIIASTSLLRIGADDGINTLFEGYIDEVRITKGIARYTANFTPPTQQLPDPSDPHGANVSLLLHMDGTNGSQSFVDSSNNNLTITANGNAQISDAEKKFGNGSTYFDGDGDYLQIEIADWNVGVSGEPFTIEFWAYKPGVWPGLEVLLSKHGGVETWNNTNGLSFNFYFNAPNTLYFQYYGNETTQINSSNIALPENQWIHFAVVYDGTTTTVYVDGVAYGTSSDSYDLVASASTFEIGSQVNGNYPFNGYIDELRVTKGVARYTANFIPQTAAFPNPTV